MNRIDRLFGILTLLQSKRYVAGEKIAEKFGISIRSVYRDIKALSEQGVPVSFEPRLGYFIVNGYFLRPVSFSSEEANALILMESLVEGFGDLSIKKHYSNALTKVKSVLHSSQKDAVERLSENIKLQAPSCFIQNFEYLTRIQLAIAEKKVLEITYSNKQQESSIRKLEPIGLIFYALSWHLIGWCYKRKEYRDFRVSRILHLNCTTDDFKQKDHIPLSEYMKTLPVNY